MVHGEVLVALQFRQCVTAHRVSPMDGVFIRSRYISCKPCVYLIMLTALLLKSLACKLRQHNKIYM